MILVGYIWLSLITISTIILYFTVDINDYETKAIRGSRGELIDIFCEKRKWFSWMINTACIVFWVSLLIPLTIMGLKYLTDFIHRLIS